MPWCDMPVVAMEIVVCIDIGSVYSGYAYSSLQEYRDNMMTLHLNEEWMSGHANLHTFKVLSNRFNSTGIKFRGSVLISSLLEHLTKY